VASAGSNAGWFVSMGRGDSDLGGCLIRFSNRMTDSTNSLEGILCCHQDEESGSLLLNWNRSGKYFRRVEWRRGEQSPRRP